MTEHEAFPSLALNAERPAPHAWIQWKGTDVCMEVHCICGAHLHYDGGFAYHVRCPHCQQVYECDGYIALHPLSFDPGNVKDIPASADDLAPDEESGPVE
jgi:hypothetical protein